MYWNICKTHKKIRICDQINNKNRSWKLEFKN
jgi:hypothetical protein